MRIVARNTCVLSRFSPIREAALRLPHAAAQFVRASALMTDGKKSAQLHVINASRTMSDSGIRAARLHRGSHPSKQDPQGEMKYGSRARSSRFFDLTYCTATPFFGLPDADIMTASVRSRPLSSGNKKSTQLHTSMKDTEIVQACRLNDATPLLSLSAAAPPSPPPHPKKPTQRSDPRFSHPAVQDDHHHLNSKSHLAKLFQQRWCI